MIPQFIFLERENTQIKNKNALLKHTLNQKSQNLKLAKAKITKLEQKLNGFMPL
jgi:hypothetical protein